MKINIQGEPQVKILEQRNDYIKSRIEYPNGFIMISEIKPEGVFASVSHQLSIENDGSYTPQMSNANQNFKDIR